MCYVFRLFRFIVIVVDTDCYPVRQKLLGPLFFLICCIFIMFFFFLFYSEASCEFIRLDHWALSPPPPHHLTPPLFPEDYSTFPFLMPCPSFLSCTHLPFLLSLISSNYPCFFLVLPLTSSSLASLLASISVFLPIFLTISW